MFETYADVNGSVWAKVLDPNGISPPARIIQTDDDWTVEVHVDIWQYAAGGLGGEWHVSLYYEGLGGAGDGLLDKKTVFLNTVPPNPNPPHRREYIIPFVINAGTLTAGIYRLIGVVNYTNMGVPMETAGFADVYMVQIYEPS